MKFTLDTYPRCPEADNRPDSYLQGWATYFLDGVALTNDSEIDPELHAQGFWAAQTYDNQPSV